MSEENRATYFRYSRKKLWIRYLIFGTTDVSSHGRHRNLSKCQKLGNTAPKMASNNILADTDEISTWNRV